MLYLLLLADYNCPPLPIYGNTTGRYTNGVTAVIACRQGYRYPDGTMFQTLICSSNQWVTTDRRQIMTSCSGAYSLLATMTSFYAIYNTYMINMMSPFLLVCWTARTINVYSINVCYIALIVYTNFYFSSGAYIYISYTIGSPEDSYNSYEESVNYVFIIITLINPGWLFILG